MADLIKIIREELQKINIEDGVADRYAEKRFNIPDPNVEMNKKAMSGIKPTDSMGEYVGNATNRYNNNEIQSKIYLNPRSLENFDENVRAISDLNGNLFVGQLDKNYYHDRIADGVTQNGRFNIPDAYDTSKIMQWHRIAETNNFGFSVSYMSHVKRNMHSSLLTMRILQARHPQFKFHPVYWSEILDGRYDVDRTDIDELIVKAKKDVDFNAEVQSNPRYAKIKDYEVTSIGQLIDTVNEIKKSLGRGTAGTDEKFYRDFLLLANELFEKFDK